jgi:hypothetical protein
MRVLISPILLVPLLIAGVLLLAIAASKNQGFHERGHFVISVIPWAQIVLTYAVAFYVRIGFGAWPRSCIDNPDLPLIGVLAPVVLLASMLVLTVLPVLWVGWFIIRWRRGFRRLWVQSVTTFVSGILVLLTLHALDPWGFWDWVLD